MLSFFARSTARHMRHASFHVGAVHPRAVLVARNFSVKREGTAVPEEFYDEEVEHEKTFLDIAASLNTSGLESLTTQKDALTWDRIDESMHEPIGFKHDELSDAQLQDEVEEAYEGDDDDDDDDENGDEDAWRRKSSNVIVRNAIVSSDIADHLDKFSSGGVRQQGILPQEFLNYNMPWRESDESTDPHLDSFVPHTSPARFTHDSQGLKSCPGKRQRRGTQPKLECHILDLDDVNHLDVVSLRRFISTDSEILSRKATGLCAKCQRKVAKTIKRSRQFGLLPHIGDYLIQDSAPLRNNQPFHVSLEREGKVKISKTISKA